MRRSRASIIETARRILLEHGPHAVTVEAVVVGSGVARSTLYRHFPSAQSVLRSAVDAVITPGRAGHGSAGPGDEDLPVAPGAVREAVLTHLLGLAERLRTGELVQVLPSLLDTIARDPSLEDQRRDIVDSHRLPLRRLLERARDVGLIGGARDLEEVAACLVGPLFYRRVVSGEPTTFSLCRDLVLDVLGPDGSFASMGARA